MFKLNYNLDGKISISKSHQQLVNNVVKFHSIDDTDFNVGSSYTTEMGKLSKRINKAVEGINNKYAQDLYNLLAYSNKQWDLTATTNNEIDWYPGAYGDNGSCYWGMYAAAPYVILTELDGQVITYDQYARFFAVEVYSGIVHFNLYTEDNGIQPQHLFNAIASNNGLICSTVNLDIDGAYINGNTGYLIAESDRSNDSFDIEDHYVPHTSECSICGYSYADEILITGTDGVCNICELNKLPEKSTHCNNCGYDTLLSVNIPTLPSHFPTDKVNFNHCRRCGIQLEDPND